MTLRRLILTCTAELGRTDCVIGTQPAVEGTPVAPRQNVLALVSDDLATSFVLQDPRWANTLAAPSRLIKAFIAVNAMALRRAQATARMLENVRPLLEAFQTGYEPSEHVMVEGKNVRLVYEMGMTDFFQDFDTIVGPQDRVADVLMRLEPMSVSTLIAALLGHADPLTTIRGLAAERKRM